MPTRDDITELDLERIRALLIDILSSDKYCALFKLQEVYELGIVLISAQGGYILGRLIRVTALPSGTISRLCIYLPGKSKDRIT